MSRITSKYDVDLRCPCCAVYPVRQVHENASATVLFCSSCEHAWVMDSANVPRRTRPIQQPRVRQEPARRTTGAAGVVHLGSGQLDD